MEKTPLILISHTNKPIRNCYFKKHTPKVQRSPSFTSDSTHRLWINSQTLKGADASAEESLPETPAMTRETEHKESSPQHLKILTTPPFSFYNALNLLVACNLSGGGVFLFFFFRGFYTRIVERL